MECRLHELRHKRRISVAAASKILANLLYSYKGMGLSMGTMCAGVTPTEGPALYYIDNDGTRLAGNLFCVGSGQTFAYGVLDAEYKYDLEDDEALELGKRSILAATHRDAFSGGFINLYHVKEEGWVKHGFMDTSEFYIFHFSDFAMLTMHDRPDLLEDEAREGRVLQRHLEAGVTSCDHGGEGAPRRFFTRRVRLLPRSRSGLAVMRDRCSFSGSCGSTPRSIASGALFLSILPSHVNAAHVCSALVCIPTLPLLRR